MLRWTTVSPTVWLLGLTSLFTDISSEMITATLPLYAMFSLQLSPAAFGLIDGVQQGGASLMRLAAGPITDRWRRYKEVAVVGYAASAVCRLGLLLVGRSAAGLTTLTLADRLGKGLRTSPRDAMISLSTPRAGLGAAFGVHRMLDTMGAMLGPIVAFAVLSQIRNGYDVVFVVSFALALIGLAILVAFVTNPPAASDGEVSPHVTEGTRQLLGDGQVRTLVLSMGGLGAATLSDSFIYLVLQKRLDFNPVYLPLLYVATPAVYMLLAVPVGWAADRVGRGVTVIAGYVALLAVYAMMLVPMTATATLVLSILCMGAYYAATDGVVAALASAVVSTRLRATGLSIVGSANDVGKIFSGLLFGWLWSRVDIGSAVIVFAVGLLVALIVAGPTFRRLQTAVAAAEVQRS
jgi:MFS family permease